MRRIDEAMARIDLVLTDSLPKAASSNNPQLHFPDELRTDSPA